MSRGEVTRKLSYKNKTNSEKVFPAGLQLEAIGQANRAQLGVCCRQRFNLREAHFNPTLFDQVTV